MQQKLFVKKARLDLTTRIVVFLVSTLAFISLMTMFVFIFKEAFPAYEKYGIWHMYTTSKFTEVEGYGIWGPLTATIMTSILAVIIATPIAIRTSFFINFRAKSASKILSIFINILAGIPSILFGIFAYFSLSKITGIFISGNAAGTMLNGSFMLSIMILPTMISLLNNQIKSVPKDLINGALALGNSKTAVIYTVVRKKIKSGLSVAIITGLARAIGETMAISMILNATGANYFSNGILGMLKMPLMTLGVYIAKFYFTESGVNTEYLFAAGIALFIIIMILILIVNKITKEKIIQYRNPIYKLRKRWKNRENSFIWYYLSFLFLLKIPFLFVGWFFRIITNSFKIGIYYLTTFITYPIYQIIFKGNFNIPDREKFILTNNSQYNKMLDLWKIFLEIIFTLLIISFCLWLLFDILGNGISEWTADDWKYSYVNSKNPNIPLLGTIMNPLMWTIVFIICIIIVSFPLALLTAIYLSEYARNKKHGNVIKFFLDALGGTPTILFGIFGSIFFIETLNLRSGTYRYSMIAGILTMVLVILPNFTRSIEQVLVTIPESHRQASLALGASKTKTIFKIIMPQSSRGIITGIILSSGRVLAETAPVFLTLGAAAIYPPIHLWKQPGHTLTTSMVNILWKSTTTIDKEKNTLYAIGSVAAILSALISLIAETMNLQIKYIYKPIIRGFKKIFNRKMVIT